MKTRIVLRFLRASALAVVASLAAQPAPKLPPDIVAYRDLVYVPGGHERQKLDLYLPKDARTPLPVILWVHGGGWQNGTKANALPLRLGYVAKGYAIASLGYRLTDAAPFPAQIQDVKAAVRWLRAHAQEYHLDPARFAAWGSSAGGHLVAMLGTAGGIKAFDVGPHLDQSSRVQAVVDYYGPSDLRRFVDTPGYAVHGRADSPEAKLVGGRVADRPDQAAGASPVTYVTRDDPPFLILHGADDPTVPVSQSETLHAALTQAGVASRLHLLPGAKHGGPAFAAPEALGWVDAFLVPLLHPAATTAR